MPLPLAGLGALLTGLVGGGVATIVSAFTKRLAFGTAAVAVWLTLTAAFVAALDALVTPLIESAPTGGFAQGLGLLPGNTGACVSAIIAAHAAAWVYSYKRDVARLLAQSG